MAREIGSAYLTIIPSFQGGARGIANALSGQMGAAGQSGGAAYAAGMGRGAGQAGFKSAGGALGKVFAGAFALVGLGSLVGDVKDFLGDIIGSASDLAETQSKTGQIFGDSTGAVLDFARKGARSLGQSEQTILDGASSFGIFGQSAGLAGDDLAGFSTEMVTLATDLASFNNTSPEDAIEAIGAALRGESEPIRRYGVLLDDATLKARAMELGIYDGTGSLTAQQRVLAAHAEIMGQTATQQGDFARTSDGLANQQRIFNAELENAKTTIGTALLPAVTDLFSTFSEWGIPILQDLAAWFEENGDEVTTFILRMADAGLQFVDILLMMMGWYLQWFDIQQTVIFSAIKLWLSFAENVLNAAVAAFGWIPGIGDDLRTAQADFATFKDRTETYMGAAQTSTDLLRGSIDTARGSIGTLRDSVQALDGFTARVRVQVDVDQALAAIPGTNQWIAGQRASGGPVVAGRPYLVGEMGPEIWVPSSSGTVISASESRLGGGITVNVTADPRYAEVQARRAAERFRDAVITHGVGGVAAGVA